MDKNQATHNKRVNFWAIYGFLSEAGSQLNGVDNIRCIFGEASV